MIKTEFLLWFDNFRKKHPGKYPADIPELFDLWKIATVDYDRINITVSNFQDIRIYSDKSDIINSIFGQILFYSEELKKDLSIKKVFTNIGIIQDNKTKCLISYISNFIKNKKEKIFIAPLLSELGLEYKKTCVNLKDFSVQISNDITDFINIGYYDYDINSCFSANGINPDKKFGFCITPGMFVGKIFYKSTFFGRFFGFVDLKKEEIYISNLRAKYTMGYSIDILELIGIPIYRRLFNSTPKKIEKLFNYENGMSYIDTPCLSLSVESPLKKINIRSKYSFELKPITDQYATNRILEK